MNGNQKYPLRGAVVSLDTPFDERDRIDLRSVERLVEYHLREGAVGFLLPAQAGEVTELSLEERIELLHHVRAVARGRIPVFAGATAADEPESYALAEAAVRAECEGVLVEVPAARKRNRAGILEFCRSFAAVGMPILMIQDLDISIHFYKRLFHHRGLFSTPRVRKRAVFLRSVSRGIRTDADRVPGPARTRSGRTSSSMGKTKPCCSFRLRQYIMRKRGVFKTMVS